MDRLKQSISMVDVGWRGMVLEVETPEIARQIWEPDTLPSTHVA